MRSLEHEVPEPEVLELVVLGLEVSVPVVQWDEVSVPGVLETVVLSPKDPPAADLPEVGSQCLLPIYT